MLNREYSITDKFIITLQHGFADNKKTRTNPATDVAEMELSAEDSKTISSYMRINHSGEVCAQYLYYSQAIFARDQKLLENLLQAADEEYSHLMWCEQRLKELNAHKSLLNPVWAAGSYGMGLLAGIFGDEYSNAFIAETESQVSAHLRDHLHKIGNKDAKSYAILQQMLVEEEEHCENAKNNTSKELPRTIVNMMKISSEIFKKIATYI